MEQTLVIVVFICGLLAMMLELFIPGAVIGMLGFLALAGSVIYAFLNGYYVTGVILTLLALVSLPVFFFMWKNVVGRFFALKTDESGFKPSAAIDDSLLGQEGETVSALRPSGIALVNDRRLDVVTRGEMLGKGERIKVIDVTGNRIVVKKA